jgi:hypothetical protein
MSERMPLFIRFNPVSIAGVCDRPLCRGDLVLTDSQAKQKFLQHLEEVDTSEGIANTLVLKFRLDPEVESALNAFVTDHGCSWVFISLLLLLLCWLKTKTNLAWNPEFSPARSRTRSTRDKKTFVHLRKSKHFIDICVVRSTHVVPGDSRSSRRVSEERKALSSAPL